MVRRLFPLALLLLVSLGAAPPDPALVGPDDLGGASVIDARGSLKEFLAGHLPGAQFLPVDSLRSSNGGTPAEIFPPEVIAVIAGRLGLDRERPVVVYASGTDPDATLVASVLRMNGFRARVLDGGFARWQAEKRPLETARPRIATTTPKAAEPAGLARYEDLHDAVLLDVRPPEQFAAGHIPGAISRYWKSDLDAEGRMRPAADLAREYAALGVTPDKPVIVYCNTGHMASFGYFVLADVLDYPNVRLYDGSMVEWSARTPSPLETARAAADALTSDLGKRLMAELSAGGPARAVRVCSEIAPEIARERSRDGVLVRRVSLKTRNPENAPDAWERARLIELETEPKEISAEVDGSFRYLRPVKVGGTCLACHGDPATIAPEVREILAKTYPDDRATGYAAGDLRGAISVVIRDSSVHLMEPAQDPVPKSGR